MAVSSLLALIDDIATTLDDISVLTKVAAHKTAGILGDDLALNAQQVSGVRAERELPVVWAVAKGSFRNKAILVPAALLISIVAPWAVIPMLMLGGAYLCYEGTEKLVHAFVHAEAKHAEHQQLSQVLKDPRVDFRELEKLKIRGAIRTDFILSAEIIVVTLGTVGDSALLVKIAVVSGIAVFLTVGVYGLVAAIVKLDDAGLWLCQRQGGSRWNSVQRRLGFAILGLAPWFMKTLSVVGTAAMFLVGGGILVHGVPLASDWLHGVAHDLSDLPVAGQLLAGLLPMLSNALFGVAAGALVLAVVAFMSRLKRRASS
jgi:predicted DNA repair protein MutK